MLTTTARIAALGIVLTSAVVSNARAADDTTAAATATATPAMIGCPAGQKGLISADDFDRKVKPFDVDKDRLDPVPANQHAPVLPRISLERYSRRDRDFPRYGAATATLLVNEDGSVAEVIVACATSEKYVAPILDGLADAKLNVATVQGKPVKNVVIVPLQFKR